MIGTSAPASAAATYEICAFGKYDIWFELPQQGAKNRVERGACATVPLKSSTSYAKIWGYWNNAPTQKFWVGTGHFNGSAGGFAYAQGTTTSPYLFTNRT
ncbi:hypothetical protein ACIOWI_37755 [Streptomyces sp. NPDC087659]|uniref:hypothetical protein n=1 Tax=Streptomyces sp. NPDC087659 TaxID=3365801 RepID=UPI003829A706